MKMLSKTRSCDIPARFLSAVLAAVAAFSLTACSNNNGDQEDQNATANARTAVAHLSPTQGNETAGTVTFIQDGDKVRIIADLNHIPAGKHGFHVHEKGDCSAPDASSAGGHFNPTGAKHAGPDAEERHVGDLGNITASQDNSVKTEWTDDRISLEGDNSIVGHAVVVHAGADDFTSQPSGASGPRIACGVIKME